MFFAALLLFHDDLRQHVVRDVLIGLGIDHHELAPLARHLRQQFERDIARGFGIIESSVRIFLDDDRR
jgi:hypothetical protein